MHEAIEYDDSISYCHLISGDDYPCRSLKEIYNHYESSNDIDFLCTKKSAMTEDWYKTCSRWQDYYWFVDVFNYKKLSHKIFVRLSLIIQKINGVKRLDTLDMEWAQGLVWGSYPRDAIEYVFQYLHANPELFTFFSYGQAAEEFLLQTILANEDSFNKRITNNHKRYMFWKEKNGSYPGILDESDFEEIQKGDYYFARKIDSNISKELIEKLNETYNL